MSLNTKIVKFSIYVVLGFSVTTIFAIAFFLRPIQDDYLALSVINKSSLYQYLNSIWNNQGGNLFPYLANGLVIFPLLSKICFVGNFIFYFVTIGLVCTSSLLLYKMVTGEELWRLGPINSVLYLALSCISFEGLFVPSYVGAFSFGTASLAHLWPILLMTISVYGLFNWSRKIWIALILGFAIGNANAGESFSALIISLFLVGLTQRHKTHNRGISYSLALFSSILMGFLVMVISPGFSNRATQSVGLPNSAQDFVFRFIKSLASFSVDTLTHPAIYLSFFVGMQMSNLIISEKNLTHFQNALKSLFAAMLLLFLALVFGGTFAYVSWHQAFGLQFLTMPVAFFSGVLVHQIKGEMLIDFSPILFLVLSFSVCLMLIRTNFTTIERSLNWDKSLSNNLCIIESGSKQALSGAELRYPPFQLGIEDVQTWDWIETGYRGWIENGKIHESANCD